jgi:hypothetical protein
LAYRNIKINGETSHVKFIATARAQSASMAARKQAEKLHEREAKEVLLLKERIELETPDRGSQLDDLESFDALPLSTPTKNGLKRCKFVKPTKIQMGAIPHALAGYAI